MSKRWPPITAWMVIWYNKREDTLLWVWNYSDKPEHKLNPRVYRRLGEL